MHGLASAKFGGALVGLAVGDALGFPLRGVPPSSLARVPGLGEDFAPRPRGRFAKGQFSDDTQLMLAVAESVALERRVDGRSIGAHIAWMWREGVLLQPPQSLADAAERLAAGTPWMSAGAPVGVKCHSALSRGVVVGLWEADVLGRLPHDCGVAVVSTHKDPACAAAAAAVARAVSLAFEPAPRSPEGFCEALAVAAGVHDPALSEELRALPRLLSWEPERALGLLRRVGVPAGEVATVDGLPPHAYPVLLTALYATLRMPHDFRAALTLVLRVGGEVDAAAAITGAILGAHLGLDAIPARLRKNLLYADHLQDCAARLRDRRTEVAVTPAVARVRAR